MQRANRMRFAVILTCRVLSIGFVSLAVAQHSIASSSSCPRRAMSSQKQPVLFLSHGGGPSFFLSASDSPFLSGMDKDSDAARYLRELAQKVPVQAQNRAKTRYLGGCTGVKLLYVEKITFITVYSTLGVQKHFVMLVIM